MTNKQDNLTDEEKQEEIDRVSATIARDLSQGKPKEEIIKSLVAQGRHERTAKNWVENVSKALKEYKSYDDNYEEDIGKSHIEQAVEQHKISEMPNEQRQILAKKYKRQMIIGILWSVAAIIATIISYAVASPGDSYYIFWGAIIVGLGFFLRALWGWTKYKNS